MGEVYRGRDPRLDRHVALKVLHEDLAADPTARDRLRREAVAVAALDHPFICKIFEIGEHSSPDGDVLFLVLEYLAGETLGHRLEQGRMTAAEVLHVSHEIAEALEAAHARGFLHRDLKPQNVMLTEQGHVKVMDFGLARRMSETTEGDLHSQLTTQFVTSPGTIAGTPAYMSPEQIKGLALDARSDLFAFGVILAEMVAGQHPFRKRTTAETLAAIVGATPDFGSQVDLDLTLQGLILVSRRLLAKAPEERYASVADLEADLAKLASPSEFVTAGSWRDETREARQIPLIGRDPERGHLMRRLDEALAGRGTLVLVAGEPGIGKTHLTSALLEAARRRGAFAVTGHCYEMEGSPPYVPFVEHLEHAAKGLPRDTFRYTLGDDAPEVAKLMPELRRIFPEIPPPLDLPPEQQRRYLFNAYRDFIARSARLTPLIALVEDLHWADEPTLLLLQHLAQAVAELPVLIVGTYRDIGLASSSPLTSTLEFLSRHKLAERLSLRRWTVAEVQQMLAALSGQAPPASLAPIVFEETEGNPFFVAEVFSHLSEEGKLFDESGRFLTPLRVDSLRVPDSVRRVLGRRLERLSDDARRVLTTGAVIGRVFPLRLLEALEQSVRQAPDVALDAMEEAERAHLIETEASSRQPRYRFVHELVRQTLVETLSLPRRQRLHLRVAEAFERIYAGSLEAQAPALAYHLYNAGPDARPEKTIQYLSMAATRSSAAAAHEEALGHLDKALSLLETPTSPILARLNVQRAMVLQSLARVDEAIQGYESALSLFDELGDAEHFIETCVPLMHLYAFTMKHADLGALVERAAARAREATAAARALVLAMQAASASVGGMTDLALASLEELNRIPADALPPSARGFVTVLQVHVREEAGQMDRVEAVAGQAARLLEQAGGGWYRETIGYGLYEPPLYLGRPAQAETLTREAIPRTTRLGYDEMRVAAIRSLADALLAQGDLAGAEETAREAVAFATSTRVGMLFGAQTTLGGILHLTDRAEEAIPLLRDAAGRQMPFFAGYPEGLLALCLTAAGSADARRACDAAMRFLPGPGRSRGLGPWYALLTLVEALCLAGRREEAGRLLAETEKVAAEWDSNHYGFPVRSAAGIAAACSADWSRSEAHHRAAIARMDAVPYVTAKPIARYWYADMLIERGGAGDPDAAATLLQQSIAESDAIGLALYARQARQRLAGAPVP